MGEIRPKTCKGVGITWMWLMHLSPWPWTLPCPLLLPWPLPGPQHLMSAAAQLGGVGSLCPSSRSGPLTTHVLRLPVVKLHVGPARCVPSAICATTRQA